MTTSIYDTFKTDDNMETRGILLDYGDAGKIKIARAGGSNVRFQKALEAKTRPLRRQIDTETLSPEAGERVLVEVFASTVVIGWEDIKDSDGKDIPFSYENCVKLFTDLPDLFIDVREQAMKAANFRTAEIEEDAKN